MWWAAKIFPHSLLCSWPASFIVGKIFFSTFANKKRNQINTERRFPVRKQDDEYRWRGGRKEARVREGGRVRKGRKEGEREERRMRGERKGREVREGR